MRLTRIYIPTPTVKSLCELEASAAHHLTNVLRLKSGDNFIGFDGEGHEYDAQITSIEKRRVRAKLTPKTSDNLESNLAIHLVQALTKSDKMDYIIQKSIELGVTKITPISTKYTDVKLDSARQAKKHHHWQQIIISACEQCGRSWLPNLESVTTFEASLLQDQSRKIILHPETAAPLTSLKMDDSPITIIVGPEGGFSQDEVNFAKQHGATSIQLGPRILRTETAGLAAIAAVQTLWGDFNS